jgi:hypothetical protein
VNISSKRLTLIASTLVLVTLAACGGSSTPDNKDVVTPTYQKNAALPPTTMNVADAKNKAAADAAAAAAAAKAKAAETSTIPKSTLPTPSTTVKPGVPTTMNVADAKNKVAGK